MLRTTLVLERVFFYTERNDLDLGGFAMGGYVTITGSNFNDEVKNSETPVLIDFWAAWCGPCRMIAPIIDQLADEYDGRIKIGKINVDEEQELASMHGIASIPAMVVYRNGSIINQKTGALPKMEIEKLFRDYI